MIHVQYITCQVGADFTRNAGDIVEVSDDEAARLFAAQYAVPAPDDERTADDPAAKGEVETSTADATKKPSRRKPKVKAKATK